MTDIHYFDAHIHVEKPGVTPEVVLALARARGLRVGLVDHIFPYEDRITPLSVKEKSRKMFADIQFLHGCEADAYSPGKIALTEEQRKNMDYVIVSFTHLGEHALEGVSRSDYSAIGARIMQLLETAIEYPHTNILAHPFSFNISGIDSWDVIKTIPQSDIISRLRKVLEYKILVEINARTLRNNDIRSQEYFISLANQVGCLFSIASDAHELEEVGKTQEAWQLIKQLNIQPEKIKFPNKHNIYNY
jgi:histidinol phosphatase-like PHP family hydrolase